ncbi:MAG TPA: flagellar filament capping protein FliD [Mycobacterium sp.]|nr:flagellar filament capping protein FliD [Mycobacterium sp.]
MSTSSTSATSSNATSSSTIFNGNSRYSSDFQAVIDRAVAIASLPITQMQGQQSALSDQTTALQGLSTKFSSLQSALDQVTAAIGGASFDASVSDSTKLTATLGDGAQEGSYSVQVVDPGTYATSMTTSSWVADTGNVHPYSIVVGGVQHQIFPSDNTAGGVASAINSQYGDQVRAVVVNVGSSSSPDYRISLQAAQLGDVAPDLLDGSTSLQTQQTKGALAQYIVNGSGNTVSSDSRSVTIANGVTVNLVAASASPVNITVTRSTSALSSALDAFATAFNATVDAVDAQHGTSSGALAGQSLVNGLSQVLSQIATYNDPNSGVGGLEGLGLSLDKTGHLTFNSFTLAASDLTNSTGVTSFLGNTTTGGFLKAVTDAMNSVTDSVTGLLPGAEADVTKANDELTASISAAQDRVDAMKTQMTDQMAAADALIANMEQQYNYLSGMFAAQDTASRSYA